MLQYTEAEEATEWFFQKMPIGRLVARKPYRPAPRVSHAETRPDSSPRRNQ